MLSIRVSKEVEQYIDKISSRMHMTKSSFLRNAIMEHLEDTADYLSAMDALKEQEKLEASGQKSTYTLEEIKEVYKDDF